MPFTAFAFPWLAGALKDCVAAGYRPDTRPHGDTTSPGWGTTPTVDAGLRADLRRALATLPGRERTLFLSVHLLDHQALSAARRLGLNKGHVSKLLDRTRERLRRSLTAG